MFSWAGISPQKASREEEEEGLYLGQAPFPKPVRRVQTWLTKPLISAETNDEEEVREPFLATSTKTFGEEGSGFLAVAETSLVSLFRHTHVPASSFTSYFLNLEGGPFGAFRALFFERTRMLASSQEEKGRGKFFQTFLKGSFPSSGIVGRREKMKRKVLLMPSSS